MVETDDVAAICAVKHQYFRLLDTKDFVALGQLLCDDVETSYDDGRYCQVGRGAVVAFLTESLGDPAIVHTHHGHHPEIVVEDAQHALGTWYLEDRVVLPAFDLVISGTAIYHDEYRRDPAHGWRIARTGYARIYEERRHHVDGSLVSFTSRFDRP